VTTGHRTGLGFFGGGTTPHRTGLFFFGGGSTGHRTGLGFCGGGPTPHRTGLGFETGFLLFKKSWQISTEIPVKFAFKQNSNLRPIFFSNFEGRREKGWQRNRRRLCQARKCYRLRTSDPFYQSIQLTTSMCSDS
jgi:hypothetical protein